MLPFWINKNQVRTQKLNKKQMWKNNQIVKINLRIKIINSEVN